MSSHLPAVFRGAAAPHPRTLLDVLDATAAAHPGAPALDAGGERLTYQDLCDRITERAVRLTRHGIGPGDRVGIRIPSGTCDLYLAILAVLLCGAAYVPVGRGRPRGTRGDVFREAGVCAVIEGRADTAGVHAPFGRPLACRAARGRRLDHLHVRLDGAAQGRGGQPPFGGRVRGRRSPTVPGRAAVWGRATGCWPASPWRSTPRARRCGWPGGTAAAWFRRPGRWCGRDTNSAPGWWSAASRWSPRCRRSRRSGRTRRWRTCGS